MNAAELGLAVHFTQIGRDYVIEGTANSFFSFVRGEEKQNGQQPSSSLAFETSSPVELSTSHASISETNMADYERRNNQGPRGGYNNRKRRYRGNISE